MVETPSRPESREVVEAGKLDQRLALVAKGGGGGGAGSRQRPRAEGDRSSGAG